MIRSATLQLASAMLVAGTAACGRTDPTGGPAEPPGDASLLDAALDSNSGHFDAAAADSYSAADEGAAAADSAFDVSPAMDAAGGPDASTDAFTIDAADASDGGDAGEQSLSCDQCRRGDQECAFLPEICTYGDAGGPLSCESPGQDILTCVAGDAGCAVWVQGSACRSDVPCCVPCMYEYHCPLGSPGNPCEQDTDCAWDACDAVSHECVTNQCGDRRQDGQETDVDCGGPVCSSCRVGQRCQSNFDCEGGAYCAPSHLCE